MEVVSQRIASRRGPHGGANGAAPAGQEDPGGMIYNTRNIRLPRERFQELENRFFSRVRLAIEAIRRQQQHVFLTQFQAHLRTLAADGVVFDVGRTGEGEGSSAATAASGGGTGDAGGGDRAEGEAQQVQEEEEEEGEEGWGQEGQCLGGCGAGADVKIVKRCSTCPERDACFCAPGWCHRCVFRWWLSRNQTKVEMALPLSMRWQARCPTCRTYFCLRDCIPVKANGRVVGTYAETTAASTANTSSSSSSSSVVGTPTNPAAAVGDLSLIHI